MELWQALRRDEEFNTSGDVRRSGDEAEAFEGQHHLMDGRGADGEEALHVRFGGRAAHHHRIGMDEGQILALFVGEALLWDRGIHAT